MERQFAFILRLGKRVDHLGEFIWAAWPSMYQDQWNRIIPCRLFPDEMDPERIMSLGRHNRSAELRKGVKFRFLAAPGIVVLPDGPLASFFHAMTSARSDAAEPH